MVNGYSALLLVPYNEELVLLYEELMRLCLLSWLFNISSVIDSGTLVVTSY